jgi:hypothetical protein
MVNGGSTTPFPQTREGREGWGSARRGQVEEKQWGWLGRVEEKGKESPRQRLWTVGDRCRQWCGRGWAMEAHARGGGVRLVWPL